MSTAPRLLVFTFREGVLAGMGHDLQLRFGFSLTINHGAFDLTVEMNTLQVDGAVMHGALKPNVLSPRDGQKIRQTALNEVLHARRFPQAKVRGTLTTGTPGTWNVEGALELLGTQHPLPSARVLDDEHVLRFETTLIPSQWGIRPYRALAGALRVQDRVVVELSLPTPSESVLTHTHAWRAAGGSLLGLS